MKASKLVKNAALKRIVTETEHFEDGSSRKISRKRLVIPLKKWAREEVKNNGEHAGICQLWLGNKGAALA